MEHKIDKTYLDSLREYKFNEIYNKFNEFVIQKNGTLVSTIDEYRTAHTKLNVKCNKGHLFSICLNNVSRHKWCPECAITKNEKITKAKQRLISPMTIAHKIVCASNVFLMSKT